VSKDYGGDLGEFITTINDVKADEDKHQYWEILGPGGHQTPRGNYN